MTPGKKVVGRTWAHETIAVAEFTQQHSGKADVYFGPVTRKEGAGKSDDCREVPCLWADVDFKDFEGSEKQARERLAGFSLPPTLVTSTGGGLHAY